MFVFFFKLISKKGYFTPDWRLPKTRKGQKKKKKKELKEKMRCELVFKLNMS